MAEELKADVVVVGAGVHGSSAALHLAKAGKRTILLDQFPVPHTRGSSHGQTRIIRQANYSISALTPIMTDAFRKWQEIQDEAGEDLFRPGSLLVLGEEQQRPLLEKIASSVEAGGNVPRWVSSQLVRETYGMNVPDETLGLIDPSAGILFADKCVAALQRLFRRAGGRLMDGWPVDSVEVVEEEEAEEGQVEEVEEEGSVVVSGRRGRVRAASLVLCPGPWAAPLLARLGVDVPLRVERIPVFYWRIRQDPARPALDTTTFVDLQPAEGHFYGVRELEYPGLVKIVFHGGPQIEPEERDRRTKADGLRRRVSQYVEKMFPRRLLPEPAVEETCLYTWTPDNEFILDRHPKYKNIVFACGFSGTGFKIAPTVGEAACRLVLGLQPLHDFSPFSASRFPPRSRM